MYNDLLHRLDSCKNTTQSRENNERVSLYSSIYYIYEMSQGILPRACLHLTGIPQVDEVI